MTTATLCPLPPAWLWELSPRIRPEAYERVQDAGSKCIRQALKVYGNPQRGALLCLDTDFVDAEYGLFGFAVWVIRPNSWNCLPSEIPVARFGGAS